jgi:hypothetical protein
MRGTTQEWLETNPLNCTSGCNHTNWDGPVREFSSDALSSLPADIGLGGSVPLEQLGPATSSDEQMLLQLLQFLPGLGRWGQPTKYQDISFKKWSQIFRQYLLSAKVKPNVVVFNVGQWLIAGRYTKKDPCIELTNMVRAMLNECDRIGATLVWRASMPDHTRYDENGNALLRKLNTAALAALDAHARERPGGSHFAFRTAYLLGAARPDRTSDGFHYGFRQVDRYRSWMACSDQRQKGNPFSNCIRGASWPPAVSRAMSMVLAHLLCFGLRSKSRPQQQPQLASCG